MHAPLIDTAYFCASDMVCKICHHLAASHVLLEPSIPHENVMLTAAMMLQAMQVQNMVWAPAIITVLTALANVPINMLLISWYDFWGAALATSVARILQLALLCGKSPSACYPAIHILPSTELCTTAHCVVPMHAADAGRVC